MGSKYEDLIIEHPGGILGEFRKDFEDLSAIALKCVTTVITAARSFFRDPPSVRDHINEVHIFESETDIVALRLKERIFGSADLQPAWLLAPPIISGQSFRHLSDFRGVHANP
jgi:uncharacterized protein